MLACGTPCTARLHTVYRTLAHRLVCGHDIDHVINDEHNRIIIVVLARHEKLPDDGSCVNRNMSEQLSEF